ncbi:hypothetical protein RchiOBHm_Chr1g0354471 [Rosa chinensis]|uniref:Uncharacterized protein n=1 Tax=Rosa chinensis TaxID=74649 RepID=A0A2P6SH52_ROSCH|nr:hypothetical protein RchiOBHm_Chr1g0354471 [Rosa chinensis]
MVSNHAASSINLCNFWHAEWTRFVLYLAAATNNFERRSLVTEEMQSVWRVVSLHH